MRTPWDALRSVQRYLALSLGDDWEVRIDDDQAKFPYCRVKRQPGAAHTGSKTHTDTVLPLNLSLYAGRKASSELAWEAANAVEQLLHVAFRVGRGEIAPPINPEAEGIDGVLSPGDYGYVVTAYTHAGQTTASARVEHTLTAEGGIQLTWTHMPGAMGYAVYRGGEAAEKLLGRTRAAMFDDDGSITPHATAEPPVLNTAYAGAPARIPLYDYDGVHRDSPATDAANRGARDYLRIVDFATDLLPDPEDDRRIAVVGNLRVTWRRHGFQPSAQGPLATGVHARIG